MARPLAKGPWARGPKGPGPLPQPACAASGPHRRTAGSGGAPPACGRHAGPRPPRQPTGEIRLETGATHRAPGGGRPRTAKAVWSGTAGPLHTRNRTKPPEAARRAPPLPQPARGHPTRIGTAPPDRGEHPRTARAAWSGTVRPLHTRTRRSAPEEARLVRGHPTRSGPRRRTGGERRGAPLRSPRRRPCPAHPGPQGQRRAARPGPSAPKTAARSPRRAPRRPEAGLQVPGPRRGHPPDRGEGTAGPGVADPRAPGSRAGGAQ